MNVQATPTDGGDQHNQTGKKPALTPAPVHHSSWLQKGADTSPSAPYAWLSTTTSTLTAREAARVQRYQNALLRAIDLRDREALQQAKAHVLRSAFQRSSTRPVSLSMRTALRALAWRMSGLLIPRQKSHW